MKLNGTRHPEVTVKLTTHCCCLHAVLLSSQLLNPESAQPSTFKCLQYVSFLVLSAFLSVPTENINL